MTGHVIHQYLKVLPRRMSLNCCVHWHVWTRPIGSIFATWAYTFLSILGYFGSQKASLQMSNQIEPLDVSPVDLMLMVSGLM